MTLVKFQKHSPSSTECIRNMLCIVWLWGSRNDFIAQLAGSHATRS